MLVDDITRIAGQAFAGTKYDYAKRIGCHQRTAQRLLVVLHKSGVLKIDGWVMCYQVPIPIYSVSDGTPDAPRPRAMIGAERTRKHRQDKGHTERANARKRQPDVRARERGTLRIKQTVAATRGMDEWRTALWQLV